MDLGGDDEVVSTAFPNKTTSLPLNDMNDDMAIRNVQPRQEIKRFRRHAGGMLDEPRKLRTAPPTWGQAFGFLGPLAKEATGLCWCPQCLASLEI